MLGAPHVLTCEGCGKSFHLRDAASFHRHRCHLSMGVGRAGWAGQQTAGQTVQTAIAMPPPAQTRWANSAGPSQQAPWPEGTPPVPFAGGAPAETSGVTSEMALCGLLANSDLSDPDHRRRKPQRGGLKERMRRAKKEAREAREAVLGDAPFGTGTYWPGSAQQGWRPPSAANAAIAPQVMVGRAAIAPAQQQTPSPFMPTQPLPPATLPLVQPHVQPQQPLLAVPAGPPHLHAPWPVQTPVQTAPAVQPVQAPWQTRVARREAWEAQAAAEANAACRALGGSSTGSSVGTSCWTGLPACWEGPQASSSPSPPMPPSEVLSCWSHVACASPAPAAAASVASASVAPAALSAPAAVVPSSEGAAKEGQLRMEPISGLDDDNTPDSVMSLQLIRQYMAANNMTAPAALQPAAAAARPSPLPPSAAVPKPAAEVTATHAMKVPPADAKTDASAATLMPEFLCPLTRELMRDPVFTAECAPCPHPSRAQDHSHLSLRDAAAPPRPMPTRPCPLGSLMLTQRPDLRARSNRGVAA